MSMTLEQARSLVKRPQRTLNIKLDKLDNIKTMRTCSSKDNIKRIKRQLHSGKDTCNYIHLIKESHPK